MPKVSTKTEHYYRERVRSVVVQNPEKRGVDSRSSADIVTSLHAGWYVSCKIVGNSDTSGELHADKIRRIAVRAAVLKGVEYGNNPNIPNRGYQCYREIQDSLPPTRRFA
jgi:hypothetical protein